jgi:UDP-glucose 4-epimerase
VKYLITGSCGFIGSHLTDVLLARGHSVVGIDDLTTGSIENILHLKSHPRFQYYIDSVTNERLLAELIDYSDAVFHLAAVVGVRLVVDEPVRTIKTNIECTELVLKHAAKKKRKVLIASTSEVYGKSPSLPYAEDGDLVYGPTTKSRWSYAFSKAIDEFLALAYHKTHALPVIIVRLFNTVGARQTGQYGMVLPRFVKQAVTGRALTVYGDGAQRRCFCHVADVTQALANLMATDECVGEIYNVGGQEEVTILDLAERIRARFNPGAKIEFVPYDVAYEPGFEDMMQRRPDISKIAKAIGFSPQRSLAEMIEDVGQHVTRGAQAEAPGTRGVPALAGEPALA